MKKNKEIMYITTLEELKHKHSLTAQHTRVTLEYALEELNFVLQHKNIHTVAKSVLRIEETLKELKNQPIE